MPLERAQRLAAGLAFRAAAGDVVSGWRVHARLGERDDVDGGVGLAVAAAVEAVADGPSGGSLQRSDAGELRELRVGAEAVDAGDLGEQPGGVDDADAGNGQQRRGVSADQDAEIALELLDLRVELADTGEQFQGDAPQDGWLKRRQLALEPVYDAGDIQRSRGRVQRWVELVNQPAQAGGMAGALDDEVAAMVEQQRDLALRARQPRDR